MKDEVLKSYINNFISENDIAEMNEAMAFEKFVNFNIVSKLYPRDFEFEDLSTGGTDDLGIDGAAIIVNGNIINDAEEINFMLSKNGRINVIFALIQSKTSDKFDGAQISNFIFGVKSLFDDKPSITENDQIKKLRKIKEKIYSHSIDFDELPELKLYFVTTGNWKEPESIRGKVKRELDELNKKRLFKNYVDIDFYDAERLKSTYREISRKTVKEIPFNTSITLPDIPEKLNIKQAMIGCIPVAVYLNLITNEDGKLSKGLFYDNVRDYQGSNQINIEIANTLKSSINQALLPLLNNGITIISKKVDRAGTKIKLTDFQIVNGCQTSNVLFKNKDFISCDTNIIVKIIETDDQEVTNQIIRATNRQTEVKDEAFESIKPFHRDLQEYYKAKSTAITPAIYYERRSKEYVGNTKVKPWQVISLAAQIKSYVATFLVQPQSTHRYFGELLDSNKERLFTDNTDLHDYYYSALLVNRIDQYYRRHTYIKLHKAYRYHIAFVIFTRSKKLLNNNLKYDGLILKTNDNTWLENEITSAIDLIYSKRKQLQISSKEAVRSKDFTQELLALI